MYRKVIYPRFVLCKKPLKKTPIRRDFSKSVENRGFGQNGKGGTKKNLGKHRFLLANFGRLKTRIFSYFCFFLKIFLLHGMRGGLMVRVLYSGSSGPFSGLRRGMACVLGEDTLLSRCLSPPRCIAWYRRKCWG